MSTIEQLAKQAGLMPYTKLRDPPIPCFEGTSEALARFAALVAEACAQVAEDVDAGGCSDPAELVKAIRAAFPMPKT